MYEIYEGIENINWQELIELYGIVGLVAGLGINKDYLRIKEAFLNSYKIVVAKIDNHLVGAGRLISDGICYGMIHDIGVLPNFQNRGIGKNIAVKLIENNEHLRIFLTYTFGNQYFYKNIGFSLHKTVMAKYPCNSEYLENNF